MTSFPDLVKSSPPSDDFNDTYAAGSDVDPAEIRNTGVPRMTLSGPPASGNTPPTPPEYKLYQEENEPEGSWFERNWPAVAIAGATAVAAVVILSTDTGAGNGFNGNGGDTP